MKTKYLEVEVHMHLISPDTVRQGQDHMRTEGQLQAVLIAKDPKTLALAERALNAFHFQTQIFRQAQQALEFLKSHAADLIMAEAEEQVHTFPQVVRGMARRQVLISIAPNSAAMRDMLKLGSNFVVCRAETLDPFMAVLRAASGVILKNRRANFRLSVDITTAVRGADRNLGAASIVNLSETGLCVRVEKPVEMGEILSFYFRLPEGTRMDVSGAVRWTKDGRAGVQFTRIEQKEQLALREWLEKQFIALLLEWNPIWKFTTASKTAGQAPTARES
jgi:hypothetical protein